MIEWLEQSRADGSPIGFKSSCERFRIRRHYGIPDFRWCLWDSKRYRNSRPRGTPARTVEGCKRMAEIFIKEVKE